MKKLKIIPALVFCAVILCACSKSTNESETAETTAGDTTTAVTQETEAVTEKRTYVSAEAVTGPATVSFLDGDGNILRHEECAEGEKAEMKSPDAVPDSVFVKWDKSDSSLRSEDETAFVAVTKSLKDVTNAITYDTVYVGSEEQSVCVPIELCGNVKAVLLQLEITYDTEILDFDKFVSTDGGVICNCDEEKGTVSLCLTSAEDITASVDLCSIAFNVKKRESTTLDISVVDIAAAGNAETPFIDVPFKVLHGDIIF